ncbi:DUF7426 family protein [Streptomyces marianii]|uniref:DUF7426 domain-containing protein n=1 Tax=Streptomyces marianii TaxID=1817406 RepID=A0A5R9E271_9ACTN|nr:hypothetical protein [Streptomyces marianii]TLQ43487.1 hypothetical protein FEF34_10320 [Streptomyces marianii]
MAGFKVLDEFLGDSLDLPVRCNDGEIRTFHIPAPSAEDGLRVEALMELGIRMAAEGADPDTEVLDDAQELDLYRTVLGPAYDDAIKFLNSARFKVLALTAMLWITQGLDAAEACWNAGGVPSQAAPNREQRRASSRAAKSTRSRGSQSGTSTPPATSRARKAAQT